jgi:diguanylate cyclase (GGDEF)-like protein
MSGTATLLPAAAAGVLAGLALAGAWLHRSRRQLAAAEHAATHDELTGLPNRRALTAHLQLAARRGQPVGVALLDLDQFKAVNDTHGHDGGDELLRVVAARLADLPAPVRLAARLSGDEFVIVIHGDPDQALAAARSAAEAISEAPIPLGHDRVEITASVGLATTTGGDGTGHRHLLHHADQAMYRAKATGAGVVRAHPAPGAQPSSPRPARRRRDSRSQP